MLTQWITQLSDFLFRFLFRFRFRYDIFISYARRDGSEYAIKLRDQLQQLDFTCFLDLDELPPGSALTSDLKRSLSRSATLVLIGTERALVHSPYVQQEVEYFLGTGRRVVPIDFGLRNAIGITSELALPARDLICQSDLTWIEEEAPQALEQGTPSLNVADSIDKLFKYTRRNSRVRLQWLATGVFVVLGGLAAAYLIQQRTVEARTEGQRASQATSEAKKQQQLANEMTDKAAVAVCDAYNQEAIAVANAEEAKRQQTKANENAAEARKNAEEAKKNAKTATSQALASYAIAQRDIDPDRSLALNNEALKQTQTLTAEDNLRGFLVGNPMRTVMAEDSLRGFLVGNPLRAVFRNPAKTDEKKADSPVDQYLDLSASVWRAAWSAAYSPDGRFIVTASGDKTARVWNAASGQEVAELKGHTDSVTSPAYSPDGRFIVTASDDGTARVWNAASGQMVAELKGHTHSVTSAAYSPDGCFIVTASFDKTARVWNAASGQVVAELKGHAAYVRSAAYSPDGRFIVTASDDKTARVWNAASGQV
ncbi:MAG: TIR domain-containing protein, partial [Acidobacteria bacterium]|nr:TIR domain-containing protein [Acidobacteriota bacterium]